MPSKNKKKSSRSKARRGVNKKEEQQGTPETQMQRLEIGDDSQADEDEDALLEKSIKLAAAEKEALEAAAAEQEETSKQMAEKHGNGCYHGYVKTEDHFIIKDFGKTFMSGYQSNGAYAHMGERLEAVCRASEEKYPEIWEDPSMLKLVASHLIAYGTHKVLQGNIDHARLFASAACHVEEWVSIVFSETKAAMDATKTLELFSADEHTLVKYLRKNIPCTCLDGKYEEVKSITKMGFCYNPRCHAPGRMVERRTMVYCTRCHRANFCSRECQEAAWPRHKEMCDIIVENKAEFKIPNRFKRKASEEHALFARVSAIVVAVQYFLISNKNDRCWLIGYIYISTNACCLNLSNISIHSQFCFHDIRRLGQMQMLGTYNT